MKNLFSHHSSVKGEGVLKRIGTLFPSFTRSEARIANHVLQNAHELAFETGASLAQKLAVSEITVSRFLHKAGFRGMPGLKRVLAEEGREEPALDHHAVSKHSSALEKVRSLKPEL